MKGQLIGGLFLSLVLAATSYGVLADAGSPQTRTSGQLTIRINNYAQLKPSVLLPAERAAADILRHSGVDPVWVECLNGQIGSGDPACASPVTPLDVVLNLLPRSMSDRLHLPNGVVGLAAQSSDSDFGYYASVFYDTVKDCVSHDRQGLPELLGAAIAHEIGHLLLGTHSHSNLGLMCGLWSGKQLVAANQGGLSFSAAETERLQSAVLARRHAALGQASPEQKIDYLAANNLGRAGK
jgi:hypothetical protein